MRTVQDRLGHIAQLADRLVAAGNDAEAMEQLRRETHTIHGSAGSFGFNEASRLAAGMEATVKDWLAHPAEPDVNRGSLAHWFVERLAEMLRLELPPRRAAHPPPPAPPSRPPRRLIIRRPSSAERRAAAHEPPPAAPAPPPPPPPAPPATPGEITWLVAPELEPAQAPPPPVAEAQTAAPTPDAQLSLALPPGTLQPAAPLPEPEPAAAPEPPPSAPIPEPVPVVAAGAPTSETPPAAAAPASEPPPPPAPALDAQPTAAEASSEPAAAQIADPVPAAATAPELIVVEDDAALAELLEYGLRARGYRFVCYRNGRDALRELLALEVCGTHPLVLLDVDLPGLDGYSVFDALERERRGVFRVVFTTVHGNEAEQLRGLEAGALDYLVKPISLRVALEKIRRWVGR